MLFQQSDDPRGRTPLSELHSHLGGAVDSAILWTIAHEQGIKLPTKQYWEFDRSITIRGQGSVHGVEALNREKYHLTELIQSSPLAMEPIVHGTLSGAYRANHVVVHEIRFNPMKRNRGGERDLDSIIMAAIRGMEKALLEYDEVRAGIVLLMDREFSFRMNRIIYEKALKYQERGIVGIDVAGVQSRDFRIEHYTDLFQDAKRHGLKITIHTGEEGSLDEMRVIVDRIEPERIGHGFLAGSDKALMGALAEKRIVLELCPTSNLNIGVIPTVAQMRKLYRALLGAGVQLTINTDGPEMHGTTLWKEFTFLLEQNIFSAEELRSIRENAFAATFIPSRPKAARHSPLPRRYSQTLPG